MAKETDPLVAGKKARSYSVNKITGEVSNLTPTQMGRQQLYNNIPFVATPGLQRKERALSSAFSVFAADMTIAPEDKGSKDKKKRASMVIMQELEMDKSNVTAPLLYAVLVAGLMQFNVGFNIGSMNPMEAVVFPGHSMGLWGLSVSVNAIGMPVGAILAGNIADSHGRKPALMYTIYLFLVGGVLQALSVNMYMMIASRAVIGLASGLSACGVPIYLGEMAPPNLRGTFGTLTQFALVLGILASDLLAFPFATADGWRYFFSTTAVIAAVQVLMSPLLLKSPRYLLTNDPENKEARTILKKLRGFRTKEEVDEEVNMFLQAGQAQDAQTAEESGGKGKRKSLIVTSDDGKSPVQLLMQDASIRKFVVTVIVLQAAQQLCGINACFYYSNMFFDGVIDDPLMGSTIVAAVNVLATYVAMLLMDSTGRRTLILWSAIGMFVSCIFIVLSLLGILQGIYALVAVNAFVSFFEIGLGPIPSLIVAEMFQPKHVATAMSVSVQVNSYCNFAVGFLFPYCVQYLGPYSFAPFAFFLALTVWFVISYMPETRGLSPEELLEQIKTENSDMEFHGLGQALDEVDLDAEWEKMMQ